VQDLIHTILAYDGFRAFSILMYAIFAAGLWRLGTLHHAAVVRGDKEVKQYPKGYFTLLAIQVIPLLMTGVVISDFYVIGTRLVTLLVVVAMYIITTSEDGTFTARRHIGWAFMLILAGMLGALLWSENEAVRSFVRDWEKTISWGSIAVMVLFVFFGQRAVARELFEHFVHGNYTLKRLSLQFVRLLGFLSQTVAYGLVPSKAQPLFGIIDPIFLQGLLGTLGVCFVLFCALAGYARGSGARRQRKTLFARHATTTV
jgi:hypothetical protein